jgi:Heterokaryon incompatibility protein (HET)
LLISLIKATLIWRDQNNVKEHNHQVRVMGKIYPKPKLVVTYLGHGKKSIKLALDFLKQKKGRIQRH